MFYKDGLGASVYRITSSTEASKNEDSVQALAVGASVERKSGESGQVAFESSFLFIPLEKRTPPPTKIIKRIAAPAFTHMPFSAVNLGV